MEAGKNGKGVGIMMRRKLNSQSGETLVEALASILIAFLSVTMLFFCVIAAGRMDKGTVESDKTYYEALAAAETAGDANKTSDSGTVTVTPNGAPFTIDIDFYGKDGLYSYRRQN